MKLITIVQAALKSKIETLVKVLDLSRANASHFENISSYWRCTVEGNDYLKESTNISEDIFESEEENDAALLEELRAAHLHHCEIHLAKHSKSEEVPSKPENGVCIKIENKQAFSSSVTPMTTITTQDDSTHNSDDSDCGMQSSSCAGMQTLLLESEELLHRQDNN